MVRRHVPQSLLSSALVIRVAKKKKKKGKTESGLNESRQGRWEKEGGVGSDTYDVVGIADSKCDYMRFTACSTAFPSTTTLGYFA